MAKKKQLPQLGDHVRIRYYPDLRAQIVELRGAFGPKGTQIYRVRVEFDPEPRFIEIPEDELEVIPANK